MNAALPQPEQPGQSVLVALFQHNAWANLKLLDFCAGLNEAQLSATAVGTYGPISLTLQHLLRAENWYVQLASGKLPPHQITLDDFPGFDVLRVAARWGSAEMLQLALSARVDTLVTQQQPTAIERYKLADLMIQAVTHSTEHRTQISAIITALGLEPPDLSGWHWMEDKGEFWITEKTANK